VRAALSWRASKPFYCALLWFWLSSVAVAAAADRTLAAVTSHDVPTTEQQRYFEVLKEFSRNAIQEFLTNLHLSDDQIIDNELNAIDLNIVNSGDCLDKFTLSAIYQALNGGCVPSADDELTFSIILPKFYNGNQTILTVFFPYGVNQLKSAPTSSNNSIQYNETYPNAGARELTEALVVVGFLNWYWENVKAKAQLTDTEFAIVWKGFGQYQGKLNRLCTQLTEQTQRAHCKSIADDAGAKVRAASQKAPQ
jgi:hypothetical protein